MLKIIHIDFKKEVNDKDTKFKVGDHVRISKCKYTIHDTRYTPYSRYTPNWSEEVFVIKNVKNTVPWIDIINDPDRKEIIGTFYEKELRKTNQQESRIEEVIKRKGDKLYVKWKGYDSSFNS